MNQLLTIRGFIEIHSVVSPGLRSSLLNQYQENRQCAAMEPTNFNKSGFKGPKVRRFLALNAKFSIVAPSDSSINSEHTKHVYLGTIYLNTKHVGRYNGTSISGVSISGGVGNNVYHIYIIKSRLLLFFNSEYDTVSPTY